MIELPEWLVRVALTIGGTMGGTIATAGVFVVRVTNRFTALETRMTATERAQIASAAATTESIREIRAETLATTKAIAQAREEALKFFAAEGDLKRLEDKMDGLHQAVMNRRRKV